MLAFLSTFESGTPNEQPDDVVAALEDAALSAAQLDLDSLVGALFAAKFENYLLQEYFEEVQMGLQSGHNPVAIRMQATIGTFVHGFCKALQWVEWLKKQNEKDTTK